MHILTYKVRACLRSRRFQLIIGIICLCVLIMVMTWFVATSHVQSEFRVVYSLDRRQNDQEIIRVINNAERYVYFAVYYFSKNNIAEALVAAKKRGLAVRGIVDRDGSADTNKPVVELLTAAGILVETQKHLDGIMHIKAVVTDNAYASGSYNWTAAATEANDEVLEIGTNRFVHDQYLAIIKKVLTVNQ